MERNGIRDSSLALVGYRIRLKVVVILVSCFVFFCFDLMMVMMMMMVVMVSCAVCIPPERREGRKEGRKGRCLRPES